MPKMDNTAKEEKEEYDYPSAVMNPTTEVDGFEWDVYPYDENRITVYFKNTREVAEAFKRGLLDSESNLRANHDSRLEIIGVALVIENNHGGIFVIGDQTLVARKEHQRYWYCADGTIYADVLKLLCSLGGTA